jgi:glycerol-3-phosphate dehydrogenase
MNDEQKDKRGFGTRCVHAGQEESDPGTGAEPNTGQNRGISRGFVLLDHAAEGVENFASIVGGKLTTHRLMAEVTADLVCDRLGVTATCETAETPLPDANQPAELDQYVREYDAGSPADRDVVDVELG